MRSSRTNAHMSHDFVISDRAPDKSCCLIFGDSGTGKSTFAARFAPSPNAFINFDGRAQHCVELAREKGKTILSCRIKMPRNLIRGESTELKKIAEKAVGKFWRNYEWAVSESEKGNIRSITIDTGTELETLFILIARNGKLKTDKRDYGSSQGAVNVEIQSIFDIGREGNAHVICLARAKSVWEGQEPTGDFEPRCSKTFSDAVDWSGLIRVRESRKRRGKEKRLPEFSIKIKKAGVTAEEMSEVYTVDDWGELGPFAFISMNQLPGVDIDSWLDVVEN